MPTIMLQPDDNPLRATGSETNFVLQTQDHLLSPVTYEIEILNCPVPIEAAAAGIQGDLASGAGMITIRSTINIQAGGSQTGRVTGSMEREWLIGRAVDGHSMTNERVCLKIHHKRSILYCNR
jgi:hypothetical protein